MADTNNDKNSNSPALRFPGFTEPWCVSKLNSYLKENKERNRSSEFAKEEVLSVSGQDGIINQIKHLGRSFAGKSVADYHVVRHGNIVYTKSPLKEYPYGIVKYNRGVDGIVSTLYAVYETNNMSDGAFVEYYFASSNRINRYFKPIVRIGAKHDMKIGNEEVLQNTVCFPDITEQKKIAAFLSLLDERIATQRRLIEDFLSLRRAILQDVIKRGLSKKSWKLTTLNDILTERGERNSEGYDICSVSVSEGVVNQIEYLGRSFAAKETGHYNVARYGDIIYTKSPTGSFPYGIVKRDTQKEPAAISPLYGVFVPKEDWIGILLGYYFESEVNTFNYLHPIIQKGAKNTINITNIGFLANSVPLPTDESEALTLTKCLDTISNKIILEKSVLAHYTEQREYLLSKMFV